MQADKCKRDRLIHVLDTIGSGVVCTFDQTTKVERPIPSVVLHNDTWLFEADEEAGCHWNNQIMKHRFRAEQISLSLSLLALSNAFGSLSYEQMDAQLSHIICTEDSDIAQMRNT